MAIRPNFSSYAPDPRNFTIPNSAIVAPALGKMFGDLLSSFQDNRKQIEQLNAFADVMEQADPMTAQLLRVTAATTPKFSFGGGGSGRGGGSRGGGGGGISSAGLLEQMLAVSNDARDYSNRSKLITQGRDAEITIADTKHGNTLEEIEERGQQYKDLADQQFGHRIVEEGVKNYFAKDVLKSEQEYKQQYYGLDKKQMKKLMEEITPLDPSGKGRVPTAGGTRLAPESAFETMFKSGMLNKDFVSDWLRAEEIKNESIRADTERRKALGERGDSVFNYWGLGELTPEELLDGYMALKSEKDRAYYRHQVAFSLARAEENNFPYPTMTNGEHIAEFLEKTLDVSKWQEQAAAGDTAAAQNLINIQEELDMSLDQIKKERDYQDMVEKFIMRAAGSKAKGESAVDPANMGGGVNDPVGDYIKTKTQGATAPSTSY